MPKLSETGIILIINHRSEPRASSPGTARTTGSGVHHGRVGVYTRVYLPGCSREGVYSPVYLPGCGRVYSPVYLPGWGIALYMPSWVEYSPVYALLGVPCGRASQVCTMRESLSGVYYRPSDRCWVCTTGHPIVVGCVYQPPCHGGCTSLPAMVGNYSPAMVGNYSPAMVGIPASLPWWVFQPPCHGGI